MPAMSPSSVIERDRRRAVAAVPALQPGQYLAVEDGESMSVIPIAAEVTRIGRAIAADIRLDDRTVSRKHARLVRRDEGVCILDDRSMNGVFVNDERVTERILRDGDSVSLGRVSMRFIDVA
jgi:pSer/pThr/pTyr-binding forkhead associated (FHA) protein